MVSLVDPTILDPNYEGEMLKCIQLGLLCVQEFPEARPTMSALLSMLELNDVTDLPHPTRPVFTHRKTCSTDNSDLQSYSQQASTSQFISTELTGR